MLIKIFTLALLCQFVNGATIVVDDPTFQSPPDQDVSEGDIEELVSIARQIREHPLVIDQFKPSVLRSLVKNPSSYKILPHNVLDRLINDPIFAVQMPQDVGKEVIEMVQSALDSEEKTDEDFYDYYDLDYDDPNETGAVGDFLSDLDPDVLKTISPSLIIAYFESASPDDMKAILNNSTILLNLAPETIGQLLQKLPKELIIQVVNSEGVKDLFTKTATNLSEDEVKKVKSFQSEVASILLEKLDLDVISSLPEFLVKSQLENQNALTTLLDFPEKLEALFKVHPDLLNEVPPSAIISVVQNNPTVLNKVPPAIFSKLLTCSIVSKLAENVDQSLLVSISPEQFGAALNVNPDILNCIPRSLLTKLVKNKELIANIPPEIFIQGIQQFNVSEIANLFGELPLDNLSPILLKKVLNQEKVLEAIKMLDDSQIQKLANSRDLIRKVDISLVIKLASIEPRIIQNVPDELLLELGSNPDLINNLSGDLVDNLSESQLKVLLSNGFLSSPGVLEKLPISSVTKLSSNIEILSLIPDSILISLIDLYPDLVSSLPAKSAAHIAQSRPWLIAKFPLSVVGSLSSRQDVQSLLSDQDIGNLLMFQPAILNIVAKFPSDQLLKFMQTRTALLDHIPPAAEPYLTQLLVQEKFIRKLPAEFLASLTGNTGIQKLLTKFSIITVLRVYPSLPTLVPPADFLPFLEYMKDPWFRLRIPCLTISLMSDSPGLIDQLSADVLEKVITSRRILSCIPASKLEKLMEKRLGLSRLSLLSMVRSARKLPKDKYSFGLIYNFLKEQAPEIGSKLIRGEMRMSK